MKQFWFIGVTTGQSMIMRLFPIWAEVLGIQETRMHGVDLPPGVEGVKVRETCLLYTSPSPRDGLLSRMPSSA